MKNYLPGSSETTSKITEEKKRRKRKKRRKKQKIKTVLEALVQENTARHYCNFATYIGLARVQCDKG